MVTPGLPWRRILGLHVVRQVETVARARGLALGFVDATTGDARSAHGSAVAPSACPWGSDDSCSEPLVRAVRSGNGQSAAVLVHRAVRELIAPIPGGEVPSGALTLGGFLEEGDAPGANAPTLGRPEIELLATLLTAAARDVGVAIAERGEAPIGPRDRYGAIIGGAPAMQELYGLLDRVARSDSTVLIQGENGTGKELVARAIHDHSGRHDHRFVVTNCSAFNDNLLDSELFGHKRGSFTGAVADKPGLFEVADTGTFFLDEIGDMSPALQVKVLRVLQEGTFNRVGDTEMCKVDVRIIAATNRDLKTMVERGQFREDLYYRINVINLVLPSLRQRKEDIPLLIGFFLERQRRNGAGKQLSDGCLARMLAYPWPGNVRELENEIERLVVLSGDDLVIEEDLLSPRIRQHAPIAAIEDAREVEPSSLPEAVEALERRMILEALRRNRWNKTRASADLKVSRRNLIRLVQKYGLEQS